MPTRDPERPIESSAGLSGRAWWLGCALVFLGALLATVPTVGDIGLTWDEPSYRTSQLVSAHWWEGLAKARSRSDLDALLSPEALLYYWPYARFGYNFHPPLAGQLNLLTHAIFGGFMKDIPSRRMASVIEYSLTITLAFGFLARRYGAWVGGVAAGALLVMPRVYGDGHIAGTDTPGLLLWVVTALAFWKGLNEPHARKWRVLVGIALGLAFVEKMAAVAVLGPSAALDGRRSGCRGRSGRAGDTTGSTAWSPRRRCSCRWPWPSARCSGCTGLYPPPDRVRPVHNAPADRLAGRDPAGAPARLDRPQADGHGLPWHPVWGVERPALETWTAILAFAPVVGWLGNPAWWRETLPRMAHYYQLSSERRGRPAGHPDHLLRRDLQLQPPLAQRLGPDRDHGARRDLAGVGGRDSSGAWPGRGSSGDAIPWYFALHLVFLPILRMLPTPAHDGVRLFLPTFFFLAAFAGWGVVAIGDGLSKLVKHPVACRGLVAALVLGSAAWQLVKIHPFELSYYNELIGGPRGAWKPRVRAFLLVRSLRRRDPPRAEPRLAQGRFGRLPRARPDQYPEPGLPPGAGGLAGRYRPGGVGPRTNSPIAGC